jgi:hypothetical protein
MVLAKSLILSTALLISESSSACFLVKATLFLHLSLLTLELLLSQSLFLFLTALLLQLLLDDLVLVRLGPGTRI